MFLSVMDLAAQHYSVRGVAGLPDEVKIAFSEHSEPLWRIVTEEDVTLKDALISVCGDQGPVVNEYLARNATQLNRVASVDDTVPAGSSVAIPFCFKIEARRPVNIANGDTLEGLLKKYYGVYGPITQESVFRLNSGKYPGMTFDEFTHQLRPGTDLVLPYVASERTLTWSPLTTEELTPYDVIESLPKKTVADPFAAGLEIAGGYFDPYRFQSIPFVQAESTKHNDGCDISQYLMGVEDLVARFRAETKALLKADGNLSRIVVGVVDTGLSRTDTFFDDILEENSTEKSGEDQVDDDDPPNGFADDVFGVGLERRNGWIYSSITDQPRGHGTKIATIAVAGIDFEVWGSRVPDSPVRLKMVSYSSNFPFPGVDPTVLALAPAYLEGAGVTIVNMSLSTGHNPWPVSNALTASKGLLVIVAAGNATSGNGKQLGPLAIYPALYGGRVGDFSRTTLTVGAHDGVGDPAFFSNYSNEYVDLLAPGCSVKTRDEDGSTVLESGTSVSTATVSFTSALIQSLGLNEPAQIKNRILASADFDPKLADYAWSSARLNMWKAVSLRHDVLELANGSVLFGQIEDVTEIVELCGDAEAPLERVRKVIPNLQSDSGMAIEIWTEQDARLHRKRCKQSDAEFNIRIVAEHEHSEKIRASEIRDIVLARL